jgi:hypothetical protein
MSTTHGSGSKLLSASFELREEDNRVPLSELGFYLASKPKHGTMSDNPSARTEKTFKIYCTNKYHKNAHTYGVKDNNIVEITQRNLPRSFVFVSFSFCSSTRTDHLVGQHFFRAGEPEKGLADDEGRGAEIPAAVA